MRALFSDFAGVVAGALRQMVSVLLALLILFEEWGWEPLQQALARIGRLPLLRQLEGLVARLPPRAALVVFLLPTLLLLPVKLGALWLIGQGRPGLGLMLIVVAKVVGTAIVARLFTLTRPALLRLAWFATLYRRWVAWKAALLARVRRSRAWRLARLAGRRARRRWGRWRRRMGLVHRR